MPSKRESMEEFRRLLQKKSIQTAYRALLSYIMELRTHFKKRLGDSAVSDLYHGKMDMTFFAIFPPSLRRHNLKIAILFNYDEFRFEAWLAGRNRQIQRQYWELLKDGQWPKYRVRKPAKGVDSILECDLTADFDLDDPDALTASIEKHTLAFIDRIDRFLSGNQPPERPKRSAPTKAKASKSSRRRQRRGSSVR